jgi:hypothetical protein
LNERLPTPKQIRIADEGIALVRTRHSQPRRPICRVGPQFRADSEQTLHEVWRSRSVRPQAVFES